MIEAAGGVVWRRAGGAVEVLVVHRPAYDDWTFPKGKPALGEAPEETALREVREETGIECRPDGFAGETRYRIADGTPKLVRYWTMQPVSGSFRPNQEVDEVRWLPPREAAAQLTYPHDRELLREQPWVAAASSLVYLVRHAHAGNRAAWEEDDRLRPLSEKGWYQARGLADLLRHEGIDRLVTSPYVRCRQTLEPLASSLDLPIEEHAALEEGRSGSGVVALLDGLEGLTSVLCSHGDVIPDTLRYFRATGNDLDEPLQCKKGSTWVLHLDAGLVLAARYLPPPRGGATAGSPRS